MEKKWKYSGAVDQLFIDFQKAYDSVRREVQGGAEKRENLKLMLAAL
jgi:hypothetical protein